MNTRKVLAGLALTAAIAAQGGPKIIFDTDMGFSNSGIWFNINPAGTGSGQAFSTSLIWGLLQNDTFRALFLERWALHMKETYATDKVIARIDKFADAIRAEIPRNHETYGIITNWAQNVEGLRSFVRNRQQVLKKELSTHAQLKALFHLSEAELNALFA